MAENIIYTVFPIVENEEERPSHLMPQDFDSYKEAKEYGESLDCEYVIEEA